MEKQYPSKLYYSISEVAEITGVKAHVLRYWETEFPSLHPKKTGSGSRRYRQVDIEEVLAIKHLLYTEGFKIAGARKTLKEIKKKAKAVQSDAPSQMNLLFDGLNDEQKLQLVKNELVDILKMIKALGLKKAPEPDNLGSQPELKAKKAKE